MSASEPPSVDVPSLQSGSGPRSFAWGKSPNVEREVVGRGRRTRSRAGPAGGDSRGRIDHAGDGGGAGHREDHPAGVRRADGHRLPVSLGARYRVRICAGARGSAAGARSAPGWVGRDTRSPGRRAVCGLRVGAGGRHRPSAFWWPRRCCPSSPRSPSGRRCWCWSTTCSGSIASRLPRSGLRLAASATTRCASCGRREAARPRRSSWRACPS